MRTALIALFGAFLLAADCGGAPDPRVSDRVFDSLYLVIEADLEPVGGATPNWLGVFTDESDAKVYASAVSGRKMREICIQHAIVGTRVTPTAFLRWSVEHSDIEKVRRKIIETEKELLELHQKLSRLRAK